MNKELQTVLDYLEKFDSADSFTYDSAAVLELRIESFLQSEAVSNADKELFLIKMFSRTRGHRNIITEDDLAYGRSSQSILANGKFRRYVKYITPTVERKEQWLDVIYKQAFSSVNVSLYAAKYPYWLEDILTEEEITDLIMNLVLHMPFNMEGVLAVFPDYNVDVYKNSLLKKVLDKRKEGEDQLAFVNFKLAEFYLDDSVNEEESAIEFLRVEGAKVVDAVMNADVIDSAKIDVFTSLSVMWLPCMLELIPFEHRMTIIKSFDDDFIPFSMQAVVTTINHIDLTAEQFIEISRVLEAKQKDSENVNVALHELFVASAIEANYWGLKLDDIVQLIS